MAEILNLVLISPNTCSPVAINAITCLPFGVHDSYPSLSLPEQVTVPPPRRLPGRILVSVGLPDERRAGAAQLVAHGGSGGRLWSPAHGPSPGSVDVAATLQ
ncbi:hypothetical protein J6590_000151 [Homalodisca vitripennis]|nr:hypothetical protein J6590_000151 [Homalodisca vitripennis]